MSKEEVTIDKSLITDDRINGNAKTVYMYLKLLSQQESPIIISIDQMAEDLSVTNNTVKTATRILRNIGYIKINKEKNPRGNLMNSYEIVEREI